MNVLLLNGSPAQPSHTGALVAHLSRLFEAKGHACRILDLFQLNLPINNPLFHDDASASDNEKVRTFAADIQAADMVVLGTPLYHGSFSGLLKAALDNLDDDALAAKKVLIVSNSSGLRNSQQAAQQLVIVARTMMGDVHDRLIGTGKADYREQDGVFLLSSPEIAARCQEIVDEITGAL